MFAIPCPPPPFSIFNMFVCQVEHHQMWAVLRAKAASAARRTMPLNGLLRYTSNPIAVGPPGFATSAFNDSVDLLLDAAAYAPDPATVARASFAETSGGRPNAMPASARASMKWKTNAGPHPLIAISASNSPSVLTHTTSPIARSKVSASCWSASRTLLLGHRH